MARQQKDIFHREQQGLQYRGATEEDLAKINDELGQASLERSERDLKTFFILSRIAEKEDIHATPADIDMRIAEIAQRYRTTTAKMRQQLERDGMLGQIALQVQEEKTVAHILSKAKITNAPPPEGKKQPKEEKPKKPKVKRAAKKTAGKSAKTGAKKTAKKAVKKASSKKAGSKSKPKDE